MYIDDLIEVFEKVVSESPELKADDVLDLLRIGIEAKKYDLQDQGLIEAILREDKKDLIDPLQEYIENTTLSVNEDIKKEAIKIFIASLEHLINYYYNNVIGKHFSSS
ncbi:MAG: hypothetical protein WBB48_11960 [Thermodesulfobacteriota bacterium]